MKIALVESILTPAGHEIDYDRLLVEEFQALGHNITFYVPQGHKFKHNYGAPVEFLPGRGVSYAGSNMLSKVFLAAKREINRIRWYKELYRRAEQKEFGAIIFPSATYRYLRALKPSPLKNSPVPVLFIIHGVTPKEAAHIIPQIEYLRAYPAVRIVIQTYSNDLFGRTYPNVFCRKPPVYIPRDIDFSRTVKIDGPIKLGFFGQYRKEKNLDAFLDTFLTCKLKADVELLVQGATMKKKDADDFERIRQKYGYGKQITFLHKALVGKEWQSVIAGVDALILPYAAERYRYQSSAMLSTAIGYYKPVLVADSMNPEVLAGYDVGMSFPAGDNQALKEKLTLFINTFKEKIPTYNRELERFNSAFAPRKFAESLDEVIKHS